MADRHHITYIACFEEDIKECHEKLTEEILEIEAKFGSARGVEEPGEEMRTVETSVEPVKKKAKK